MEWKTAAVLMVILASTVLLLAYTADTEVPGANYTAHFLVDGKDTGRLRLELADDPEERRVGLMNRTSLPSDTGMIFVYSREEPRSFWMKNTRIPLDMIFVDGDRQVINVEHAEPEPGTPDYALERYRSDGPAKYVIETNQGFADRHGIGNGTEVVFGDALSTCCS